MVRNKFHAPFLPCFNTHHLICGKIYFTWLIWGFENKFLERKETEKLLGESVGKSQEVSGMGRLKIFLVKGKTP